MPVILSFIGSPQLDSFFGALQDAGTAGNAGIRLFQHGDASLEITAPASHRADLVALPDPRATLWIEV
jgi:hypothetical protein